MLVQELLNFFLQYGYLLAIPVMIVEGPVATMVMAALASLGHFNVIGVFLIALAADLISDYVYYQIGVSGGPRIINPISRFLGFNATLAESLQPRFQAHGAKAIFLAKLLPGMVPPVFIAAGMAKYPVSKLYKYAVPGGMIWTGGLVLLGYYFGKHLRDINSLLSKTGIVLAILVIVFILYEYIFGKKMARRFVNIFWRMP